MGVVPLERLCSCAPGATMSCDELNCWHIPACVHMTIWAGTKLYVGYNLLRCFDLCRPLPAPELGQGWTRVKHVRPSGRSEWIFHAPGGRTFRSKKCAFAPIAVMSWWLRSPALGLFGVSHAQHRWLDPYMASRSSADQS